MIDLVNQLISAPWPASSSALSAPSRKSTTALPGPRADRHDRPAHQLAPNGHRVRGDGYGSVDAPALGDEVYVSFPAGNPAGAGVIALRLFGKDKPPKLAEGEKHYLHKSGTKSGSAKTAPSKSPASKASMRPIRPIRPIPPTAKSSSPPKAQSKSPAPQPSTSTAPASAP